MDAELRDQLETKLYDRMKAENGEYLKHLKTLPTDEIIENAYQIAYRENILYIFEDETNLPEKRLRILLAQDKPLAMLYDDWCSRDVNEMSLLREGVYTCTSGLLDQIAEEKFSSPTAPMFAKSFENAQGDDELAEWKANQQRNEHCNKGFLKKQSVLMLPVLWRHFCGNGLAHTAWNDVCLFCPALLLRGTAMVAITHRYGRRYPVSGSRGSEIGDFYTSVPTPFTPVSSICLWRSCCGWNGNRSIKRTKRAEPPKKAGKGIIALKYFAFICKK